VGGDRLGQLAAQAGPAGRVGEPVARHGRRAAGNAHGGQHADAQEAVTAQQVGSRGKVRPGGELGPGRSGRAAPGERGRRDVEHHRPQDRHARAARVAEQDTVADVQRERVAQHQPADRRRPEQPEPYLCAGGADVQGQLGRQRHLSGP